MVDAKYEVGQRLWICRLLRDGFVVSRNRFGDWDVDPREQEKNP
jgi:hypothetical protein